MTETKQYKLTVDVLGVKTTKTGKTALDALSKFTMTWEDIKGKGVLFAEYGDQKWERNMNAPTLRRIFNNKITKESWAKSLTLILQ